MSGLGQSISLHFCAGRKFHNCAASVLRTAWRPHRSCILPWFQDCGPNL